MFDELIVFYKCARLLNSRVPKLGQIVVFRGDDYNFLDIALIILSIVGLLLFVLGFQKRSQSYAVFGGTAFITPIFYLIG